MNYLKNILQINYLLVYILLFFSVYELKGQNTVQNNFNANEIAQLLKKRNFKPYSFTIYKTRKISDKEFSISDNNNLPLRVEVSETIYEPYRVDSVEVFNLKNPILQTSVISKTKPPIKDNSESAKNEVQKTIKTKTDNEKILITETVTVTETITVKETKTITITEKTIISPASGKGKPDTLSKVSKKTYITASPPTHKPINLSTTQPINSFTQKDGKDNKNIEQSIRSLKQSVQLDPKQSDAYYNLGMLYTIKEDKATAGYYFDKALRTQSTINPNK